MNIYLDGAVHGLRIDRDGEMSLLYYPEGGGVGEACMSLVGASEGEAVHALCLHLMNVSGSAILMLFPGQTDELAERFGVSRRTIQNQLYKDASMTKTQRLLALYMLGFKKDGEMWRIS